MLDRLAAVCGDGLNPALHDMLDARAAIESPGKIVEIATLRAKMLSVSPAVAS